MQITIENILEISSGLYSINMRNIEIVTKKGSCPLIYPECVSCAKFSDTNRLEPIGLHCDILDKPVH